MKHRILELTMSIMLIVSVYIAVGVALPASTGGNQKSNNQTDEIKNYERIDFTKKTVVVDGGHGGMDGGKQSASGVMEKDINLTIAYDLKQMLEDCGIHVVMTRTDDSGLYSETDRNKKVADMKKRCEIIDNSNADMVISIHQNSFDSSNVYGAQVFYYKHSTEGKKLAQILQSTLKENLDKTNKRVEKANDTYYMLIHTKCPIVIAECGFLSNPEEATLLSSEDYQMRVATALYNGIIEYLMSN